MTQEDFDKFLNYVLDKHIKGVLCSKSKEYSRGNDKLYNFKRASEISGKSPIECLRGMKLKHDVSIEDLLDEERDGMANDRQSLWQEKLHDEINYLILLWALLYEKYDWSEI